MTTETQIDRLRADIGADSTTLPSSEADDVFAQAGETYTTAAAIEAYARVIAIQRLLASSAKRTTYRQNQSSENLSDVFKHLQELLKHWQGELTKAKASGQSVASFGRPRAIPQRIAEFPDA